jgi:N-acetylmuramoyl-L-alanine amidase
MRGEPAQQEGIIPQAVVTWCAGRISDPVLRLRFLQAVAPALRPAPRRLPLLGYVLAPLLLLLPISIFLIRGNSHATARPVPAPRPPVVIQDRRPANVWLVEQSGGSETYSNGLRVDSRFAVSNHPRSYLVFPIGGGAGVARSRPAGIVFHTTESLQAPFEAGQNRVLKRIGESLLTYIKKKRAYNFLIDRFGRVYRIVAESDAANHAGYSVWADDQWLYMNLNESFLGVSFEAETKPGETENQVSAAQLRAAAMLIEMLRSRYGIAGANCVTHGQVSVNPSSMVAGYHIDWASSFPFQSVGLMDNYAQPLPAVWAFGFEADPAFLHNAGPRLGASASMAEASLAETARAAGLSVRAYRKMLRRQYRDRLAALRRALAEDSE